MQGGILSSAFLQLWDGKQARVGQEVLRRLARRKCHCSRQDGGASLKMRPGGMEGKGEPSGPELAHGPSPPHPGSGWGSAVTF